MSRFQSDVLRKLTPAPGCKFVRVEGSDGSKFDEKRNFQSEKSCFPSMSCSTMRRFGVEGVPIKRTISAYTLFNMKHEDEFDPNDYLLTNARGLLSPVGYVPHSWFHSAKSSSKPKRYADEHISIFANNTDILFLIDNIRRNFSIKYKAKAYVHWYEKFGVERDEFDEAIESLESINDEYVSWTKD